MTTINTVVDDETFTFGYGEFIIVHAKIGSVRRNYEISGKLEIFNKFLQNFTASGNRFGAAAESIFLLAAAPFLPFEHKLWEKGFLPPLSTLAGGPLFRKEGSLRVRCTVSLWERH